MERSQALGIINVTSAEHVRKPGHGDEFVELKASPQARKQNWVTGKKRAKRPLGMKVNAQISDEKER